ncbi:MAG: type IV toxin-antitoxin system AbiEi family antitoxin domain-containing protein [Chloroflexi bacterium]|nr:type IV toxin-antitoxin system AbiEi family antitoxin domain-containing protein [Chloroflexota bacterium]
METITKPKQSLVGIEMVRRLAHQGDRIFSTDRARQVAPGAGLKAPYLHEALHHLARNGWIVPLRRGLYALSSAVPGVAPVHEFEVAMALVSPAAVSHWSALHHHGMTEQAPRTVFVLTTTESAVPRTRQAENADQGGFPAGDTVYRFIQVRPHRFFGTEQAWVGEARVSITDRERTLLDGLSMPQHCGGFPEVLHALGAGMDRLDVERMAGYAVRLNTATAKRLGWALEHHGYEGPELERLARLPIKGYRRLDPTGRHSGPCNSRWMLRENLPGMVEP